MIALLLTLAMQQGWETEFPCYLPPFTNRCDVRLHPHQTDLGLPTQDGCDTVFPGFGQIGTTLKLYVHRNRCSTVGSVITQGSPVVVFIGLGYTDPTVFIPGIGWDWVADSFATRRGNANSKGVTTVNLGIPNDPILIGLRLYFQAFVCDNGTFRESTGGRLEIW